MRDIAVTTINVVKEIGNPIAEFAPTYAEREASEDSIPQERRNT